MERNVPYLISFPTTACGHTRALWTSQSTAFRRLLNFLLQAKYPLELLWLGDVADVGGNGGAYGAYGGAHDLDYLDDEDDEDDVHGVDENGHHVRDLRLHLVFGGKCLRLHVISR